MSDHTQYKLRRLATPQFADCFNFHKGVDARSALFEHSTAHPHEHVHNNEAPIWVHQS
jgi:hypothetical protein